MSNKSEYEYELACEAEKNLWFPPDPLQMCAPSIRDHNREVIQEAIEKALAKVCSMISKHNETVANHK